MNNGKIIYTSQEQKGAIKGLEQDRQRQKSKANDKVTTDFQLKENISNKQFKQKKIFSPCNESNFKYKQINIQIQQQIQTDIKEIMSQIKANKIEKDKQTKETNIKLYGINQPYELNQIQEKFIAQNNQSDTQEIEQLIRQIYIQNSILHFNDPVSLLYFFNQKNIEESYGRDQNRQLLLQKEQISMLNEFKNNQIEYVGEVDCFKQFNTFYKCFLYLIMMVKISKIQTDQKIQSDQKILSTFLLQMLSIDLTFPHEFYQLDISPYDTIPYIKSNLKKIFENISKSDENPLVIFLNLQNNICFDLWIQILGYSLIQSSLNSNDQINKISQEQNLVKEIQDSDIKYQEHLNNVGKNFNCKIQLYGNQEGNQQELISQPQNNMDEQNKVYFDLQGEKLFLLKYNDTFYYLLSNDQYKLQREQFNYASRGNINYTDKHVQEIEQGRLNKNIFQEKVIQNDPKQQQMTLKKDEQYQSLKQIQQLYGNNLTINKQQTKPQLVEQNYLKNSDKLITDRFEEDQYSYRQSRTSSNYKNNQTKQ